MKIVNPLPLQIIEDILLFLEGKLTKNQFEYIDCGSYSEVYRIKNYCIKKFFEPDEDEIKKEELKDGEILEELQGHPCVPTLYFYEPYKYVVYEYIEGKHGGMMTEPLKKGWEQVFLETLEYVLKKGYIPNDAEQVDNVIFRNGLPVLIDVGLYKKYSKPLNQSLYQYSKKIQMDFINRRKNALEVLRNF